MKKEREIAIDYGITAPVASLLRVGYLQAHGFSVQLSSCRAVQHLRYAPFRRDECPISKRRHTAKHAQPESLQPVRHPCRRGAGGGDDGYVRRPFLVY